VPPKKSWRHVQTWDSKNLKKNLEKKNSSSRGHIRRRMIGNSASGGTGVKSEERI